jgi:hypothetical protein
LRIGNQECAGLFSWQTASFEVQRLWSLPLAGKSAFWRRLGPASLLGSKYAVPQES